jgi:hypothetical protein
MSSTTKSPGQTSTGGCRNRRQAFLNVQTLSRTLPIYLLVYSRAWLSIPVFLDRSLCNNISINAIAFHTLANSSMNCRMRYFQETGLPLHPSTSQLFSRSLSLVQPKILKSLYGRRYGHDGLLKLPYI